jgi:hypothetical protein
VRAMAQPPKQEPIKLLSVVIPCRNEGGAIASTVEHLHIELRLHNVEHETVTVGDGSTNSTWAVLQGRRRRLKGVRPSGKGRRTRQPNTGELTRVCKALQTGLPISTLCFGSGCSPFSCEARCSVLINIPISCPAWPLAISHYEIEKT